VPRPALELADIFRQYGPGYRQSHSLPLDQLRVMRAIEICRTAVLGGHIEQCSNCPYTYNAYNSCRNRHCPKCQSLKHAEWVVYAKPPFGGPQQVLEYLGRYTHRVAIPTSACWPWKTAKSRSSGKTIEPRIHPTTPR